MEAQARVNPSQQIWAGLPDHLMELIMRKLQEGGGMEAAAVLRLVCKAWRDAFTHFPGSADFSIADAGDKPLERLCKLMPRLSELQIWNTSQQLDLSPLGSCSQLTKLEYDGSEEDVASHPPSSFDRDLSLLPKSLRELELEGFDFNRRNLGGVKFLALTKLTCLNTSMEDFWLWDLLQCLPALKKKACQMVRQFIMQDLHAEAEQFDCQMTKLEKEQAIQTIERLQLQMLETALKLNATISHSPTIKYKATHRRMSALTILKLSSRYSWTLTDTTLASCLHRLQGLKLHTVEFPTDWANALFQAATRLTLLDLNECGLTDFYREEVAAAESLRTLHLIDSHAQLLELASPSLQSLSSEPCKDFQVHMGRLTALTRLELKGFDFSKVQLLWEQLAVQELIAVDCTSVFAPFFLPAAMPALRKLYIKENDALYPHLQPMRLAVVKELMSHPHLHQLSGHRRSFTASVRGMLATWQESAFTEHIIESDFLGPHEDLMVWTKPDH